MKVAAALVLALFACHSAIAQGVYRCTDAGGKAVFQQAPCSGGQGRRIDVSPNVLDGEAALGNAYRQELLRSARSREARARGMLVDGMTTGEMYQLLGQPVVVNSDNFGDGARQQHVFRYQDGSARYVYTHDGKVVGVQNRPAAATRELQPCYTELEIRNAGVGRDSNTLGPEGREQIRRRVEEMRRCRR